MTSHVGARRQRYLQAGGLVSLLAVAPLVAACGDSSGAGGAGGAGDGQFHPEPSGVAADETPACEALLAALQDTAQSLDPPCIFTAPVCPNLVRSIGGAECLQYDQGTVAGCASYYRDAEDCDDFVVRRNNCVVEPIADSAPAGCPE